MQDVIRRQWLGEEDNGNVSTSGTLGYAAQNEILSLQHRKAIEARHQKESSVDEKSRNPPLEGGHSKYTGHSLNHSQDLSANA